MNADDQFVHFLQSVLPRLQLRWPGFRMVRGQVRKRINRRMAELGLQDLADYRAYLEAHAAEWQVMDDFCRISISRFYRDQGVFQYLADTILPEVARRTADRDGPAQVWSAACASGEEPYTLAMIWQAIVRPRFPQVRLRLVATDADEQLLERARRAMYPVSSLREIPENWRREFFAPAGGEWRFHTEAAQPVEFLKQDIRLEMPEGPFAVVLCRNLVFTYFDEDLQREILERIVERMAPGGFLVVGRHERLPPVTRTLAAVTGHPEILRLEG